MLLNPRLGPVPALYLYIKKVLGRPDSRRVSLNIPEGNSNAISIKDLQPPSPSVPLTLPIFPPSKLQHRPLIRPSKPIPHLNLTTPFVTNINSTEIHTPHHPRQHQAHLQISQRFTNTPSRSEKKRRKRFILPRFRTSGKVDSLESVGCKHRRRSGKDGIRPRHGEEVEFGFSKSGLALRIPGGHEAVRVVDERVGEVGGVMVEGP